MIDHDNSPTALPIYLQISELLIREIAAGRLPDGQRLPPERKLAEQYGITVRTLRKSLKELTKLGLLESVQGSGNYVRSNKAAQSIYSMFRLELIGGGGLPTAQFLDIMVCSKPDDLPDFGTSDTASRIRRLRFLNKTAIAVEEIWLDADSGTVLLDQVSDSLYRYYQTKLGFWITHAQDAVSIAQVPDWAPEGFGPSPSEITGYIERLSWAQGPAPVEFSRTWFDTSRAHYMQRIT
ncbi:MAG: GntR family transcriptional regulator [Sulfitobacter sp.]